MTELITEFLNKWSHELLGYYDWVEIKDYCSDLNLAAKVERKISTIENLGDGLKPVARYVCALEKDIGYIIEFFAGDCDCDSVFNLITATAEQRIRAAWETMKGE